MSKSKIEVGSKVRLTRKFLKNTGQFVGSDASSKWTVLDIFDDMVVTDQEYNKGAAMSVRKLGYEDISDEEFLRMKLNYRRIHINNLEVCK